MVSRSSHHTAALLLAALSCGSIARAQPKIELLLPLGRTVYQTNEAIHLAVVRSAPKPLAAGDLTLAVQGADGSEMSFTLGIPAVPAADADARATEHLSLDGRLLRPGHYTIEVASDGAAAKTEIDVCSHVRRSSYRLVCWGRAKGAHQLFEGEDGLGFNLFYGHYAVDREANFVRAGVDFMRCCTMGGGHQMDLRTECDWSDPYVSRGGAVRVVRQALADRTRPNVPGVHFYDEPGLTYHNHGETGQWTPHGIPSQARAYRSAFGRDPLAYHKVDPKDPEHVARWRHFARWKLGFMDAAWKLSQFGVQYVRPDWLSVTQSQYGFSAYTDGYYFNVVRCLPITSGHGGYHDYGLYLLNPSWFLEMALARDHAKPCWYLPTWYGQTTSEQFRLEQYVCFAMGIQGLITPPDIDPFEPAKKPAAEGVIETNKLAARLGTVFTTMPPTYPPVVVLYSLSHMIHAQTRDRTVNYLHDDDHGRSLPFVYLAGLMLQHRGVTVVEEDVLDGTLAARHKAVILASIDYLPPEVVAGLEAFAAGGGLVLTTADCEVKLKGAIGLGVTPRLPDQALVDRLRKSKDEADAEKVKALTTLGKKLQAARPLAEALRKQFARAGIEPVFECDNLGIVASRHAAGDVEYLFAVNAATDWQGPSLNTQATTATISLHGGGRAVYDAVRGGPAAEFAEKGGKLTGAFRFGPGQMRAFARTARPIGGVDVLTPVLRREYATGDPLSVEVGAVLRDAAGGTLSGSVPLRIRVIDPLGAVRYDLYRATRLGVLRATLPLAANDAPGVWTVSVRELLAGREGRATFRLPAVAACGAVAGRRERAIHFGRDRDNIFRFFRVHRKVTIATGTGAYNAAAARRLAKVLEPWDVQCRIVPAADLNRPRTISDAAAKTWVGLDFGRVKGRARQSVGHVGFAVDGPVVLLGTPEDNPLIAFLLKNQFLPYAPVRDGFPGRRRGYLAWQRDGVGHGRESITAIAYDAAGMAEAVGTLYEAMSGMEPLTPWAQPKASRIRPAARASRLPAPKVAWQAVLPDRAVAMSAKNDKLLVLTRDESLSTVGADGKAAPPQPLDAEAYQARLQQMKAPADAAAEKLAKGNAVAGRPVKFAAGRGGLVAVGHWGGLLRVLGAAGKPKLAHQFQHDIAAIAWQGETLVVGLSDGRVVGLRAK